MSTKNPKVQKSGDAASFSNVYRGHSARSYDSRRFTTAQGKAIHEAELSMFRKKLGELTPGSKVLEVGCGTGRFIRVAAEAGMACSGIDPSPDMLHESSEKLGSIGLTANLLEATGQQLPFDDGQFDFVYAIRALNQMGSRENALLAIKEMLRVARVGGIVLVEYVNARRQPLRRKGGDVYLWPAEVANAAADAGAESIDLRGLFFLGMTAVHLTPAMALPGVMALDSVVSRLIPRACSRCYSSFRKVAQKAE